MNLMRIDKLFDFEKGSLQSSKCVAGNYNFITASADWKTHFEYTHDSEALVFAAAASGSLGRTHYVNGKFIASDLCFILSPKDPINLPVDLQFYHILFNELRNDIVKNTKSGTSKEAIGLVSFGKYEIPYLDIVRQTVIKNRLVTSEVTKEKLSTEISHQLDLIKKLRQQLLQDAIHGKLVKQDANDEPASKLLERIKAEKEQFIRDKKIKKDKTLPEIKPEEIPFEIPESWVWCRLGDTVLSMTNGIYKEDKFYNETGIGCLRMYNIKDGRINFQNLKRMILTDKELSTYSLEENDILLNRVNSIELLGKAGLIEKLKEPLVFESKNIRLRLFKKGSLAGYINYVFQLPLIKSQIYHSFKKVTGQASISQEKLNPLLIPLPPANEQFSIVTKIKQLMKLCDELEQSIQQNQKYTQELLQVALKEALEPAE